MFSTRVNLEQYQIPLEEILLATNHFSSEVEIGRGGAGVIFGGELSERWQNRKAVFKRLYLHCEGCNINIKSDVYSFGVLLFEMLSGMLANESRSVGDAIYGEIGLINTQLDIYAFGVVMLETLSGTKAYKETIVVDDQAPQTLVNVVRHYYHKGLDMLIDPSRTNRSSMDCF
ncbi:hypothetical protein L1887_18350 [Cichorium endivia]|nr:hypothetical protein L1887_18350 [Cichorium endivia]